MIPSHEELLDGAGEFRRTHVCPAASPPGWQTEALAPRGSGSSRSAVWFRISFVSWRPKQFVAVACCQAASIPSLSLTPSSTRLSLFLRARIGFFRGASWSAALSEYICSNHVLSPHLDILKGHNLKPYRTDGEANGKRARDAQRVRVRVLSSSATCDMQCNPKGKNGPTRRETSKSSRNWAEG